MRKYLLVLFGMALVLSEITIRVNAVAGFFLYCTLITGCLLALSKAELDNEGKLMISLTILPIVRIAQLFITFDEAWKAFFVYYMLFFLVVFYSIRFKINPGYTKKWLGLLPIILIIGVLFGLMGYWLFDAVKYYEFIFLIPVLAFSEEVLFRGIIQNLIREEGKTIASIIFPSILYALFGIGFGWFALFLFFASLGIGLIYHYTKNIFLCITISLIMHSFILLF